MKSKYASLISQNNSNNQKLNHLNVSTYNNYALNQFTSTPKKIGEKTKQAIKSIKAKFKRTYYNDNTVYNSRIVNDIIFNEKSTTVATFKDFLIFDDNSEFLKRFYKKTELRERLLKIYSYYNEYSKIFPNYIILSEAKYIYKNIQRKQRMIDNQQIIEMKAKKKTYKKKNIDEEELSGDVFNTQIVDSIMNLSSSRLILNETQEFLIQEFKSLGNNGFAVGNKRNVSVDSINNLIEVIDGKRTIEPGCFNKYNLNSNTKSSSVSKVFDRKMFKDKTGHIKLVNNKFNSAFNTINSNSNSNNNIKNNNNTLLGSTNTTALNQINHSKHTSEVISSSNNFNDPAFQSIYSNSKEIKEANNKGSSIINGFNRKSSVEQGNMSKRGFNLNKISSPNNNEKVEKGNLRLSMNKLNYEHYGISGLSSNNHNNNNNNGLTVSQFNNKIPNSNVNNKHSILNLNNLPNSNNQDVKRMPLSKRDSTNTIEANNNYNSNPNSNINSASNTMYSKSKVLNSNTVRSLKQNKNMFNKPGVMPPIIQTSKNNNNKTKEGFFTQTPYNRNNRDSKDKGNFNANNTKGSTLSNNFNTNTNNNYTHHNNQTPLSKSGSNTANNANFNTINYNSNYYNSINNNTPLSNNNITNNTTSTYNNSNTLNANNNYDTNVVGSNNNTGIGNSQPIQNNIIYIINQNSNNNVNVYNIHHQIRKSESQIYVENNSNKDDKLKNSNIKKDSIPSSSIGKVKKLIINDTKFKDTSNNSTNLVNTQKQIHYKNQSLQNANSLVNSTNNKLGNITPNNTVKLKINAEKVIKNLKEKTSILEANVHFKNKLKTIDYSELEAHNKKPLLNNSNNNENNSNDVATNKLLQSVNKPTIQANTTAKDNKVKARIINVERTSNNNNRNIHFKDNSQDYLFRNSSMKFKTINPESTTNNNRNNILDSTKHIKHGSIKDIKTSTHSKLASMGNIGTNVNDLHFNPVTHQKTNSMSVRNKKK